MAAPHVTVEPDTTVADARRAADAAGASLVVVLRDGGVLDAIAERDDLTAVAEATAVVWEISDRDPPATRPNATASELVERVRKEGLTRIAVTDASGRLLGVVDGAALLDLARRDELP